MRQREPGRGAFALLALAVLLAAGGVPAAVAAPSTSTTTSASSASTGPGSGPASLVLSVVPPKLPADGGSYPAVVVSLATSTGAPSLAVNDTVVFLTSSQPGVGGVSPQVTIGRGEGFAVANFTTDATPGATTISASSTGLAAASTSLTTATPSGFATRLSVIPVPASQLANPSGQGTVLIETLDSGGFPAKASSNIAVALTSSDNSVVSLPSERLTLAGGSVLSSAAYDVGASPGVATITVSASGFATGSGTVTVQGASPFALSIFAQPDPIATTTTGRLVVTLLDPQGNPAPAPSPVTVAISSSDTGTVASDPSVTIPAGAVYAVASFASEAVPGVANLTASSPGLLSAFALVTVAQPVSPARLAILAEPDPVPANEGAYDSVVVALTDAGGNPALAAFSVSVTLTSSNAQVGDISGGLTISAGSSYGVATFTSTFFVGSTYITASAQNLQSASAAVSSYGPVPAKAVVQAATQKLPADGGQYPALEVVLEDARGLPAVAPSDITVQLTSSSTSVAAVEPSVVIGAGQSYALASVTTTISPGVANITATSSGFPSSSTGFTTTSPAPSQLGFFVAPASGTLSLGQGGDAVVAVQLQDSTSSPAAARQDTQVVVTSSNGAFLSEPIQLDIPAGEDYAWTYVRSSQAGQTVLTASTNGLASANATLSEAAVPVSVTLVSSTPGVALGATAILQLQVEAMGSPVVGANVSLSTTAGSMAVAGGVTDSSGLFSDTFVATANGLATVTALVHDPLIGTQTAETNIIVSSAGAPGAHSRGLGLLGTLLPVLVVLIIVAAVALGARSLLRSRMADPEEAEERPDGRLPD